MRRTHCPSPGTVVVREAPVPRPAPGEVLLAVRSCGICGSDLHWYGGDAPPPTVCPGHELTAEVAAVGPDVTGIREGDRVTAEGFRSCGACEECRVGRAQRCDQIAILGLHTDGAFADYVVTDAERVFALPYRLDDAPAQLTEPLAVGVHAMRMAGLRPGHRVLILGAGSIGLLAITAALQAGAGEVAISARRPHQTDAAGALGAHAVVSPDTLGSDSGSPSGFDVVLDTVAAGRSLDDGLTAVRAGGTIVVVGVYTAPAVFDAVRLMSREVRLAGAMCYGREGGRADFEVALDILGREAGRIGATLLTHRVPLDDIGDGFRLAADKTTGSIKVSVDVAASDSAAVQ